MSTIPATALDVERIRADFPILSRTMRGKPLVYLDNGATSLKPQSVIDAEVDYLTNISANVHRGVYELSERATVLYDESREKLRRFLNAPDADQVVFTKSATEASNLIAHGWGRKLLTGGDEIVVTELEHHANIIPWQEVARATGAQLRFVPLGEGGWFDEESVASVLSDRTRLVAITGMSNVTGYRPPVKRIVEAAHTHGAIAVVDGAQLVSHATVDVQDLGVDFLTFSGHKMCGPTGVGVLYGRAELLDEMDPLLYGGDMIVRVHKDRATYKPAPDKFETGTPNISGAIAIGAAVDYLTAVGMDAIAEHEHALISYAIERLSEVSGLEMIVPRGRDGEPVHGGGIVSFTVDEIHTHDVGAVLDAQGIAVRTGYHCAQPFMRMLGINGTVRASVYLYNTMSDIDALVDGLAKVKEMFR